MKKYNKNGISLIVLIITIIVMIILAAAIILSISNSGIMDKANKAKKDSDTANLKEYVNVLEAEWELGVAEASDKTKTEYVNEKLGEKYPKAALSADGEIYSNLTENARKIVVTGVKIGDTVTGYTLSTEAIAETTYTKASDSATTVTTKGLENTYDPIMYENSTELHPANISREESIIWRYMGVDDEGNALIVGDVTANTPTVLLGGLGGYTDGSGTLDAICNVFYSNGIGTARNMKIEDVIKILDYTEETSGYTRQNEWARRN